MAKQSFFQKLYKNGSLERLVKIKGEKTQAFTTLVLTLIALSFFGFFAINPTLTTIVQLKKQLADNMLVEKKLGKKIKNLEILRNKYALLENDIPIVLAAIPKNPDVPTLLGQIQAAAQLSNISIGRLQTFEVELNKPDSSPEAHSNFAFAFEGEGSSYDNISDFLSTLVNFDRIITIELFSITDNAGRLKIDLRGKAYFKK